MFEEILKEVSGANNKVVAYESKNESNKDISKQLGVSESSTFGKIVNFTAGISIENGWLRLFGGEASENIESIASWNQIGNDNNSVIDEAIMIGYDVKGGFFAINSGAFNSDLGIINYYAPDTLAWESLDLNYIDFFYCSFWKRNRFFTKAIFSEKIIVKSFFYSFCRPRGKSF